MHRLLILLRGSIVTRFRSTPFFKSNLPVSSVSTTTWNSFPPAATSKAVALREFFIFTSRATRPFTLLRSKPFSGSLYSKLNFASSWAVILSTLSRRADVDACSAADLAFSDSSSFSLKETPFNFISQAAMALFSVSASFASCPWQFNVALAEARSSFNLVFA